MPDLAHILDAMARIWMDEELMIHSGDSVIDQWEYAALRAANPEMPWPSVASMRPSLALPQAADLGRARRVTVSALKRPDTRVGTGYCTCGARISANKDHCLGCARMGSTEHAISINPDLEQSLPQGTVEIDP